MKLRTNPKVFGKQEVKKGTETVGYIQLVDYLRGSTVAHLEYEVDELHRNQGIMTREIKKYFKWCKKWGHNHLLAIVKEGNIPSIKLLESNGFIRMTDIDDKRCYIIDLNLTADIIEKIVRKIETDQFVGADKKVFQGINNNL